MDPKLDPKLDLNLKANLGPSAIGLSGSKWRFWDDKFHTIECHLERF